MLSFAHHVFIVRERGSQRRVCEREGNSAASCVCEGEREGNSAAWCERARVAA